MITARVRHPHPLPRAMRHWCSALALTGCVLALVLAGCGITIHPGGTELAFLRDGTIWVIAPDGTNARSLTSGNIVSLAWSPDHHQVLYRLLVGGTVFPSPTQIRAVPDAAAGISLIGINGGFPLGLTRDNNSTERSDAWWNPSGNRLVYRQEYSATPSAPIYVVSQSDQPAGIASKPLLNAASLPVLSSDGHEVAVLGSNGDLRVGEPSSPGTVLAHGSLLTLPGSGRPAHLLWQPLHSALLYPAAYAAGGVRLTLAGLDGKVRWSLSVPALVDAAFSPDGSLLLVRTPTEFEVFKVGNTNELFSWSESDAAALPWWAPDSNRLVVLDHSGLILVDIHKRFTVALLTFQASGGSPPAAVTSTQWHPATTDPWEMSGDQIVFAARKGDTWRQGGKTTLPASGAGDHGLYVVALQGDTPGLPELIDSGNDILPTWSYPDPSTTFLIEA
jgi:hypothetical protein